MTKAPVLMLWLAFLFLSVGAEAGSSLAVVSIRQYQETGLSNIHLYLYTLDGKLVRQLTDTAGLDDVSPMFDTEGKTVVFFRQATTPELKAKEGSYVLDLDTNKLARLSPAETTRQEKDREPSVRPIEFSWPSEKSFQGNAAETTSCSSKDGTYRLIRKPNPAYSETNWKEENGPPFLYFLETKDSAETLALASLPDYPSYFTGEVYLELNDNPFLVSPGYAALFMTRHIDSTTGNGLYALDLKTKRWTELSENAGLLYFVPGRTGVVLLHSSRYEALGKSGLWVTCGYLEFWDATFKPKRLGPTTSLFHGAAIYYGPGQTMILRDPEYGS